MEFGLYAACNLAIRSLHALRTPPRVSVTRVVWLRSFRRQQGALLCEFDRKALYGPVNPLF